MKLEDVHNEREGKMAGSNLDLKVIAHWHEHHELLPVVQSLSPDFLEELADAMPFGTDLTLVQAIEDLIFVNGGRRGANP